MGKNLLIKITMGESPNEMGNCPFAPPPLVALLIIFIRKKKSYHWSMVKPGLAI
jgi:hypothetical protein